MRCPVCFSEYVLRYTLRFGCPLFCEWANTRDGGVMQDAAIKAQSRWVRLRVNSITPEHTRQMNERYGLNEPFWPSYRSVTDYMLMLLFEQLGTDLCRDTGVDSRLGAADAVHSQQRELFALWDEIERRVMVLHDKQVINERNPSTTYPWEYDAKTAKRVHDSIEVALQHGGVTPDDMESFADSVVMANSRGGAWQPVGGKARRVGGPKWAEDEEQLGLYRREQGEH